MVNPPALTTVYHLSYAQRDELPALAQLDQQCLGGMWTLAGYQREWESPNSVLLRLTHLASGVIGGGAFWQILEEAHITLLMIHPDHQGQGLGSRLLATLLAQAVTRQLERATLEVRVSNQRALALYEKFGFQVAGRRKKYYPDTQEDALILWRNGLQHPSLAQELSPFGLA
ncbi:ribosomal protein S18-alanine N-acetyltransferase [Synechocystis sp. LKSZ1]|uniref:ribosomal protein S18-alanine N-acetyltransferase n=1 Tax=Synechocystis sp. LKSZ1 TaxID=3144951 RepID=UPI00336BC9B5